MGEITRNKELAKKIEVETAEELNGLIESITRSSKSLFDTLESFFVEYSVVMPLLEGDAVLHTEIYSGMTDEQLEELTLADTAYAILKNVQAVSNHLGIPMEEVVSKALKGVEWYETTLKEVLHTDKNTKSDSVSTKRVENYFITIDKLSKHLFDGSIESGDRDVEIRTGDSKSHKFLLVDFDIYEDENIKISKKLSSYEKMVLDAAASLFHKNNWITPYMVYELVALTYNNKADANPSKSTLDEISEILDTCMNAKIKIDVSNDYGGSEEDTIEGALFPAYKRTQTLKGRKKEGYFMLDFPLHYIYAASKKQVVPYDTRQLKTSVKFTKEIGIIRNYLLYRIGLMKNKKNKIKSDKILYETVFKNIEFKQNSKSAIANAKSRLKTYSYKMLDEFIEAGIITSYDCQKEKNGIIIKV